MPGKNPKNYDCWYFYYSTCQKGSACRFRHGTAALGCEITCSAWLKYDGHCPKGERCEFRHMKIDKPRTSTLCYWESQEGGCRKPHCPFKHVRPRDLNGTILPKKPLPATKADVPLTNVNSRRTVVPPNNAADGRVWMNPSFTPASTSEATTTQRAVIMPSVDFNPAAAINGQTASARRRRSVSGSSSGGSSPIVHLRPPVDSSTPYSSTQYPPTNVSYAPTPVASYEQVSMIAAPPPMEYNPAQPSLGAYQIVQYPVGYVPHQPPPPHAILQQNMTSIPPPIQVVPQVVEEPPLFGVGTLPPRPHNSDFGREHDLRTMLNRRRRAEKPYERKIMLREKGKQLNERLGLSQPTKTNGTELGERLPEELSVDVSSEELPMNPVMEDAVLDELLHHNIPKSDGPARPVRIKRNWSLRQ